MSEAISVLSVMSLPWMKALWLGLITSGRICFIRLARVLVIILRVTLHREIGLKSLGGGFDFGNKAYVGGVYLAGIPIVVKNIQSHPVDIFPYDIPVIMVEESWEAIWPRGCKGFHVFNGLENLILGKALT
ncbi:hypothetical protein A2U01_0005004 [Trifolium medium]|uniref:Uncharacterized protein n=1 Tax=Trifolium medium TaxID=97028 RepID=A0A392MAJ6_9FABA|nr:hypothetical protein [Trifolium medium]